MLWTRLILAIAKSWNLKPESGTWKQEESIGFLSNLKMCFCLLVELDVFGFLVPPQEMATFSTKSLHFPGGVPKKTKKPKILDSSPFAKTLKSLFFLVFLVPPQEIATFSTKSLHFPGGVPKKTGKTFSTKSLHFPGGVPKKPKKPKTLQASPSPRL